MTYPEDVMRAAREALDALEREARADRPFAIARAIMAERDRCAKVAEEFRRGAGDPVCAQVAAAIRKGE
jgi:hypothetical protein